MKSIRIVLPFLTLVGILYAVTQKDVDLYNAVVDNNVEKVKSLIAQHANVNTYEIEKHFTPLHVARDPEIVHELLIAGADPNAKAKDDTTPLFAALYENNIIKLQYLLDVGAQVNSVIKIDKEIYTPLRWAAEENNYRAVLILLEKNAAFSDSLIASMRSLGNNEIEDLLESYKEFKAKNNLDALYADGFALIHSAVLLNFPIKVDALALAGASLEVLNKFGRTPLHMAVARNFSNIVQKLIDFGADIDKVDAQGNTPLDLAYKYNKTDLIELLKKQGAHSNTHKKIAPMIDALKNLKKALNQLNTELEYLELYA